MVGIALKRICGDPVGLSPNDVAFCSKYTPEDFLRAEQSILERDGGTCRLDLLLVLIGTNRIVERV